MESSTRPRPTGAVFPSPSCSAVHDRRYGGSRRPPLEVLHTASFAAIFEFRCGLPNDRTRTGILWTMPTGPIKLHSSPAFGLRNGPMPHLGIIAWFATCLALTLLHPSYGGRFQAGTVVHAEQGQPDRVDRYGDPLP